MPSKKKPLAEYERKRDFSKTKEPSGRAKKPKVIALQCRIR